MFLTLYCLGRFQLIQLHCHFITLYTNEIELDRYHDNEVVPQKILQTK